MMRVIRSSARCTPRLLQDLNIVKAKMRLSNATSVSHGTAISKYVARVSNVTRFAHEEHTYCPARKCQWRRECGGGLCSPMTWKNGVASASQDDHLVSRPASTQYNPLTESSINVRESTKDIGGPYKIQHYQPASGKE